MSAGSGGRWRRRPCRDDEAVGAPSPPHPKRARRQTSYGRKRVHCWALPSMSDSRWRESPLRKISGDTCPIQMSQPGEYQPERPISGQRARKPGSPGAEPACYCCSPASGGHEMDRRTLLRLGGGGLLGAGLGACAARSDIRPPEPAFRLPIVNVAWNRVIRTTVGLRPYRPSGFVLRADKLDGTTVLHNYGHGGSGISLSWGTGRRVAEMALEHRSRQAAVIGCGAVGLATARQLQRRGFEVTIYAMSVPPNTTSNMAWAGFTPGRLAGGRQHADARVRRPVPGRRRDLLSRVPVACRKGIRNRLA